MDISALTKIIRASDSALQGIGSLAIFSADYIGGKSVDLAEFIVKKDSYHVKKIALVSVIVLSSYSFFYSKPESFVLLELEIPKATIVSNVNNVSFPPVSVFERAPSEVTPLLDVSNERLPSESLLFAIKAESSPPSALNEEQLRAFEKAVNYTGSTKFRLAILNMAASSQYKFMNMAIEYNTLTGKKLNIKSAWRSVDKQKSLVKTYGSGRAAGPYSSSHAIAAMDIDRRGERSIQIEELTKMNLLNKHGLWVPPYVGEAWHVEDPSVVYFRFWDRKDARRKIYSDYVAGGMTGFDHDKARIKDNHFTLLDSYSQVKDITEYWIKKKALSKSDADFIREYMLLSVRSESMYGKQMISKTGAKGWWMFTTKTANAYNLKYPMQLKESARATIELALDNKRGFIAAGMTPSVEDIYKCHMIGLTGNIVVKKAVSGITLSKKEEDILDRVIPVNLPLSTRNLAYKKSGNDFVRNDGVSSFEVASSYTNFFNKRLSSYKGDNLYLESLS